MRNILYFLILIVPLFYGEGVVFSQTRTIRLDEERLKRQQDETERRNESLHNLRPENVASQNIALLERKALPFRSKRTSEQNKRLLPGRTDFIKYASLLRQPNVFLIKIFPDLGCEENANIIRADEICINAIPNSAFYSFREREHTNEYLSDLRMKNGFFVSDGIFSQGILVSLGSVPLEDLTLESKGLEFLNKFTPETDSKEILRQSSQFAKGFKVGDFEYRKYLPVVENATYVLRVVAYRGNFWKVFRGLKIDVLEGDERADLVVAFSVVGKSEDGSLTLLWKELQRKKAPKVIFPKANKKA